MVQSIEPVALTKFKDAEQRQNLTNAEIQQLHEYYKQQYGVPTKLFDFTTDAGCKAEIAAKKNWHALTDAYAIRYPWAMYSLIRYRETYVRTVLRDTKTPLAAKSVGSTDLTSDYDITIAAEQGKDVAILRQFNQQVKKDFNAQPGTVFDTNIYLEDYVKVIGNIPFDGVTSYVGLNGQQDKSDWQMNPGDQDIAALIKQRRFSFNEEWNRYVAGVCEPFKGNADLQRSVQQQYQLADTLFNLAVRDLLEAIEQRFRSDQAVNAPRVANEDAIRTAIDANLGSIAMLYKRYEKQIPLATLNTMWQLATEKPVSSVLRSKMATFLEEVQQKNAALLNFINAQFGDLVLEVSNELYAKAMEQVRKVQLNAQASPAEAKILAKQQLGLAIFFASEAYHSEGAVLDIVMGSQEKDEKRKAEVRQSLQPIHLLESFNEQYGDFLKDIKHYTYQTETPPGRVYYRCSKYLKRLFAVADELSKKEGFKSIAQLPLKDLLKVNDSEKFKQAIDTLLQIRKGLYKLENTTSEAAAEQLMTDLKVQSVQDLVSRITAFAQAFNADSRKCMGMSVYASGADNLSFIKAYSQFLKG